MAIPPEVWSFAVTKADKDTLTYWNTIKQPDKSQFVEAMSKEINLIPPRSIGSSYLKPPATIRTNLFKQCGS
jgi:hypothetical protein